MSEPVPPRTADVAKNEQESFRFFDLPAELREIILEMALLDVPGDSVLARRHVSKNGRSVVVVHRTWRPPALLATCQQLRKEAGSIYFKRSEFYIGNMRTTEKWLQVISKDFRTQISMLCYCGTNGLFTMACDAQDVLDYFSHLDLDITRVLKYCGPNGFGHYWTAEHHWRSAADVAKEVLQGRRA